MATAPHLAVQPAAPDPWAGETRLVREAILMVASNAAPRVLVAGLTFGERILDDCRRSALEAGVRVRVRPTASEHRVDLVIEAVH
jgi:hypothetical protein